MTKKSYLCKTEEQFQFLLRKFEDEDINWCNGDKATNDIDKWSSWLYDEDKGLILYINGINGGITYNDRPSDEDIEKAIPPEDYYPIAIAPKPKMYTSQEQLELAQKWANAKRYLIELLPLGELQYVEKDDLIQFINEHPGKITKIKTVIEPQYTIEIEDEQRYVGTKDEVFAQLLTLSKKALVEEIK